MQKYEEQKSCKEYKKTNSKVTEVSLCHSNYFKCKYIKYNQKTETGRKDKTT